MGTTRAEPAAGPAAAGGRGARPPGSRLRLALLALGGALVFLAVVALAYEMAAARVPQQRAALEDLIRHETGLEVRFSGLSVGWGWYGPEAVFHGVELGEPGGGALLRAPRLIVGLDAWRLARSGRLEASRITLQSPDIDLAADTPAGTLAPARAHARASELREGRRILARWRGGQIDIEGGTLRALLPGSSTPAVLGIRRARLRRAGAEWSADAQVLLPDSLGGGAHLALTMEGDPDFPEISGGSLSFEGWRLEFAAWRALANDLQIARFLPRAGSGNLELRATFANGRVSRAEGSIHAQALVWSAPSAPDRTLAVRRLSGDWQLLRRGADWHLRAQAPELAVAAPPPAAAASAATPEAAAPVATTLTLDAAADGSYVRGRVQRAPLAVLAALAGWQSAELPLAETTLAGLAPELSFDWSARRPVGARLALSAELEDLTLADLPGGLSLSGLSAHVEGGERALEANVAAHAARLTLAREQPFSLDGLEISARLSAGNAAGHWQLATDRLEIRREGVRLAGSGMLGTDASGAPLVNAHFALRDADVALLAALLGPRVLAALGPAGHLTAGHIDSAGFDWRGPLGRELPWDTPRAQFTGTLALHDARLGAGDVWPEGSGIDARIDWRGARVHAAIDRAQSGTFRLAGASADWDARGAQLLRFSGRLTGSAQEALSWMRTHPQAAPWAPGMADMDLRGNVLLDLEIAAPPGGGAAAQPPRVRAMALLDGGELRPIAGLPPIQGLRGTLAFAVGHLQHSTFIGQWLGGPVSLSVGEHHEHGTTLVAISARGLIEAQQAVHAAGGSAHDASLAGNAEWSALLTLPPGADPLPGAEPGQARWQLHAETSLIGVASRLPEPLAKSAGTALPLHLELQSTGNAALLQVGLGERVAAIAALSRSGDTWRIERGAVRLEERGAVRGVTAAPAPVLPEQAVMLLDGHMSRLDLTGWLTLWREAGGDAALPALQARLTAAQLSAGQRNYSGASVTAQAAGGGGALQLQSDGLSGTARWPAVIDASHPAQVHLASVNILGPEELALGAELALVLAPAARLSIDELSWQGRSLGRFTAALTAHDDVLDASELRLSGAGGEILGGAHCQRDCRLKFSLDSADAGATLAAFGLRPDLRARHAQLEGDLSWSPHAGAALATLEGHLHMQLSEGTVLATADSSAAPFALLSVPALLAGMSPPTEVAPLGLRFTQLAADYQLRDGEARTSDLHFDGDAEILVQGRVGLVSGDYDEQAWILRGEDRLPAAVRRLGATPGLAAVWLSLRDILAGSGADRGRAALRLRGTWNDPIVTPSE